MAMSILMRIEVYIGGVGLTPSVREATFASKMNPNALFLAPTTTLWD